MLQRTRLSSLKPDAVDDPARRACIGKGKGASFAAACPPGVFVRTEDLRPEYRWLAERTYCWVVGWHTHFLCLFCPLRKNEEDCQEVHPELRKLTARKVVRRGVRLPKMQLRKPPLRKTICEKWSKRRRRVYESVMLGIVRRGRDGGKSARN